MKLLSVLITAMFLLLPVTVETTDERRFNILKFGQTDRDYVMFTHDMSQFETGFTLCTWVRKLYSRDDPTWFSYAISSQEFELSMTDKGTQTTIFGDDTDLTSYYTVTPGTWFHNCLSWDSTTSTRDVYIDGVRVNGKATPAGRTLGQGGTIVLGNEQHGVGTGMDNADIFGGELYKLNMFTRKLSDSEIREMSRDRCSEVEMKYGEERGLTWEEVLGERKYGNVTVSWSGCISPLRKLQSELLETKGRLNTTLEELERTKQEKDGYLADLQEKEEQINSTSEELEQTKSDLENKEEQLNSTSEELKQTKSDLENKEEQLNSTSEELRQTKSDLEKKEEQLNSTSEELQQTKSGLERKEEQLNSTSEELEQTKERLDTLQDTLENTTRHLNWTTTELEQIRTDKDICLETKEDQTGRLEDSETQRQKIQEELYNTTRTLNTTSHSLYLTRTQLAQLRVQLEKSANFTPVCSPNSTVNSHWDLLYSERFFGGVVTEEKLEVLRTSIQKLG